MELRDWLPLMAVLGPILAAMITLAVTRYFRERKRLTFIVVRTEDLMLPLRRNRDQVSVRIDNTDVLDFNRGLVFVHNNGNVTIKEPAFSVKIDGNHDLRLFNISAENARLKDSIDAGWDREDNADLLRVAIPFLNPKERFQITIFFNGPTVDCEILCRIEGVVHVLKKNNTITAFAPEAMEALLNAYERIPGLGFVVSRMRRQLRIRK